MKLAHAETVLRHSFRDESQRTSRSHPLDAISAGVRYRIPYDRIIFYADILWLRKPLLRLDLDKGG